MKNSNKVDCFQLINGDGELQSKHNELVFNERLRVSCERVCMCVRAIEREREREKVCMRLLRWSPWR